MYLSHFGFHEYPFSLTPDTDFFYKSASHRDALNVLRTALHMGEGFIKVTAEIGLGKTLLCRLLLRNLDANFVTAYIPDPLLSPHSLRVALAEELSIPLDAFRTDEQLLRGIQQRLIANAERGQRTVVLIDEAQQLAPNTLESVRLLTNLETEKSKLLQVVIVGQPELDRRLKQPELRQLRQRISFECFLRPLDADDTRVYIAHRVSRAGAQTAALFSSAAARKIYAASRGTPRLINMLCHKALLAAFGRGETTVRASHAKRAIADSLSTLNATQVRRARRGLFGLTLPPLRRARLAAGRAL